MNRILVVTAVAAVGLLLATSRGAEPPMPVKQGPLDWSLGEWVGTRRDVATHEEVKLRLRVEPILGGVGQAEHLEAEHKKGAYRGFTVRTPDEAAGRWVMTYWNSKRPGSSALLYGDVDPKRSIWRTASPQQSRQSRLLSERKGADEWRRTMTVSEDQGKTWRELWVDELKRQR